MLMKLEFSRTNKKKNNFRKRNMISVFLTLAIIGLLIISGPISAVIVNVGTDKTTYTASDNSVVFTVDVDVEADELIPVQNLTLTISGDSGKSCVFDVSGANLTVCENLAISKTHTVGYGTQDPMFGYGYGYGADEVYNTTNQTFGSGTGYGYSSGYSVDNHGGELRYQVTWNISAESPSDGTYTANLQAFAESGSDWRVYMDRSPTTITIDRTLPIVLLYDYTNSTKVKNGESLTLNISVSDGIGYGTNNCTVLFGASSTTSRTISPSSGWCNGTVTIPTDVGSDGLKALNITLTDTAGNMGENSSYYINLDNTGPGITISSIGGDSSSPYATTDTTPTFSLTTGEAATCRYASSDLAWGSMTAFSTTGSTTHSVTTGQLINGLYTYYVRCRDSKSNEGTKSFSFTVSSSSSDGTGGSTGSTGSTSFTTGGVNIAAGEIGTITISQSDEYGVTEVLVEVKEGANNVKVVLTEVSLDAGEVIEGLLGSIYKYLTITAQNLDDSNIESAKIRFKIEKSWFEENNLDPETVLLNRYSDDTWAGLETTMTEEDDTYYYYEASTPGFSYFAVTAREVGEILTCGNGICDEGENFNNCPDDCPEESEPVCGNNVCETGENCGSCLTDCPCAEGYVCSNGICKSSSVKRKPITKTIVILLLVFATIGVVVWLINSLKEEHKVRDKEIKELDSTETPKKKSGKGKKPGK